MKRLVVATTNPGKAREVEAALHESGGWSVELLPGGLEAAPEDADTFLDNAILKACHYSRLVDALTLADDSGLSVHSLGGRPGVHSARYAPTAETRNRKLLAEIEAVGPNADRTAIFHCALALAKDGNCLWSVETRVVGEITQTPAGNQGFGYDPIFRIPALGKTMAELSTAEKNRISARGQALARLREAMEELRL